MSGNLMNFFVSMLKSTKVVSHIVHGVSNCSFNLTMEQLSHVNYRFNNLRFCLSTCVFDLRVTSISNLSPTCQT